MKLLCVLLSCWSLAALAVPDCTPLNLITQERSPFQRLPVRDQGKMNICYAITAADLLNYHLMKKGVVWPKFHPGWVAVNYAQAKQRRSLQIGVTSEAINVLRQNCDHDLVSADLRSMDPADTGDIAGLSLLDGQVSAITAFERCQKKVYDLPKIPRATRYNFKQLPNDNAFEEFIASKLRVLEVPLSITYCSNIWNNPGYDGIRLNLRNQRDLLSNDCHYHESLVVGKKTIDNQCHFLVRNSWGSTWTKDNRNWTCLCRNRVTHSLEESCHFRTHGTPDYEVLACWLPSRKLALNVGAVTILDEAPRH